MVSLTGDMNPLHPDRNIALELVRATEAAAIRAVPYIGRGDKLAADWVKDTTAKGLDGAQLLKDARDLIAKYQAQ